MNDHTPPPPSNEELRATVFDQVAVGIAVSTLDGHLVETNAKCAEILGYTRDELRSRTFLDITHPDDVGTSRRAMEELLDRRISAQTFEKRYIRKDGSEVWSWTTVTLLERRGRPTAAVHRCHRRHRRPQARRERRCATRRASSIC